MFAVKVVNIVLRGILWLLFVMNSIGCVIQSAEPIAYQNPDRISRAAFYAFFSLGFLTVASAIDVKKSGGP